MLLQFCMSLVIRLWSCWLYQRMKTSCRW